MPSGRTKSSDPAILNHLFDDLVSTRTRLSEKARKYNPGEHKDKTRSRIALIFVWGYIGLIGGIFVLSLAYNLLLIFYNKPQEYLLNPKDIVLLVTSAVGTSVGFVVGYYFKGEETKQF